MPPRPAAPDRASRLDFSLRLAYIAFSVNKRGDTVLKSFTYLFEELPLIVSNGTSACEVSGFAEITYDTRGAWSVDRIGFEGFRPHSPTGASVTAAGRPSPRFERTALWLDTGDPIQLIIYDRLEHEWCAKIQRQVDARILDDRDDGLERTADHAVALRRELS